MTKEFTVPIVVYYNVAITAHDPDIAIQRAEAYVNNLLPMAIGTMRASGPPQCVESDTVWDQYEEEQS